MTAPSLTRALLTDEERKRVGATIHVLLVPGGQHAIIHVEHPDRLHEGFLADYERSDSHLIHNKQLPDGWWQVAYYNALPDGVGIAADSCACRVHNEPDPTKDV